MLLTDGYLSMAQACGEVEPLPRGWVAGEDFDPDDPDEMDVMREVWERERIEARSRRERELERRNEALADEVRSLRRALAVANGEDPDAAETEPADYAPDHADD